MKNILVTGSTGFTGSHILEVYKNHLSDTLSIIPACKDSSKLSKEYRKKAMQGNLHDAIYLDKITKEADIICHVAAWAEMNGTIDNSEKYFLTPTINLIDKAIENKVKRFIFLSAVTSNSIENKSLHTKLHLSKIWAHYSSVMKIEKYLRKVSQDIEVIILRAGFFSGKNYSLGVLPILLPRLKTHLVPWIEKGNTSFPLIDGKDLALAFKLSVETNLESNLNIINIVGKEVPKTKEVFQYLHDKYNYPLPHFSVSFSTAYLFARFMRFIYKVIPGEPLIVPNIVLLLEETHCTNDKAKQLLNYAPKEDWKDSIDIQIKEMKVKQIKNMKLNKEVYQ